jgi:Trypsin-like peptidase domain
MTNAIAKIYEGDSDEVIGVGFWVFPGYLLTCAHVVNQALGSDQNDPTYPDGYVVIEFPHSVSRHRLKGRVIRWYPVKSEQREDDIAVLEIVDLVPDDVKPMSLALPRKGTFVTKGYSRGNDEWGLSTCLTVGAGEVENDLVQLENPTQRIEPGYSGAPVWEEGSNYTVGMIALSKTEDGVAWMISASVLRLVLASPDMLSRSVDLIDLGDFSSSAATS